MTLPNTLPNNIYSKQTNMKTQHQFQTNQLGVTYSQFGENLFYQLQLNYKKLHGQATETTSIGKRKRDSKTN